MSSAERWFAIAGVAVLGAVAAAGFALAVYAAWLFHDLPDATRLAEYRPPTSTRVFASDGTLIGEFSTQRRLFVPYDRIPKRVRDAFLAAEDRSFFQHGGIDVGGLGRAAAKAPFNAMRGRRLEGGSTITQQVAKNVLLTNESTLGRKLKEAILARRLEATLSKEQILELYLNEIFLGFDSYGIGAAAYNYFGKSLDELTVAEAAYLATLPKGPNNYHPIRRHDRAVARRNWIIGEMGQLGWITREEAKAAQAEPLKTFDAPRRAEYADADFFVEEVRRRARGLVKDVYSGGYYLRTTLDPQMQSAARIALMKGLEAYDRRHGWRGGWGNVEVAPGWEEQAKAKATPAERRTWRRAIVLSAGDTVRIRSADDGREGALTPEDVRWAKAGRGLKVGDLIFVEPIDGGGFGLRQVPIVNGALVAIDPWTGKTLAMVGGYSFSLSKFNRATQAKRQPGSSFKPFVYASALENGFTPASIVLDAPITFTDRAGNVWSPENYTKEYFGPQTLRHGLTYSRNVMTVRLAQQVGMKQIAADTIKYGAVDRLMPVLSMALGAGETTPFKLTAAYSAFANGGRRIDPYLVEVIQDRNGEIVYRGDARMCPGCDRAYRGDESPRLSPKGKQVMDPITAYQITSYLEDVVRRGTAVRASVLGRPVAGKTGTTNEYRSAWFVGYTPDLVVGVFIGFDDNRSLGDGESGSSAAVPIFVDFMTDVLKTMPVKDFRKPEGARYLNIRGYEEAFRPGTEPQPRLTPEGGEGGSSYQVLGPAGQASVAGDGSTAPQAPSPAKAPAPRKKEDDLEGLF